MQATLTRLLGVLTAPALAIGLLATPARAQTDIVQTATQAGNFTTLVAALQATGLDATLGAPGTFTVFAPTDAAFAALPPGTVQRLLLPQNQAKLSSILLYHVAGTTLDSTQVLQQQTIDTLNGQRVDVALVGGQPKIDAANLILTDIVCTNGIIHVIDAVLMPNLNDIPQTAALVGGFDTLITALTAANLATVLSGPGPFTVFAPTDLAFVPLPVTRLLLPVNIPRLANILTYHVVPGRIYADQLTNNQVLTTVNGQTLLVTRQGDSVFVNGIQIQTADVETANGNIHVIGDVLLPPVF